MKDAVMRTSGEKKEVLRRTYRCKSLKHWSSFRIINIVGLCLYIHEVFVCWSVKLWIYEYKSKCKNKTVHSFLTGCRESY